jgi:hypothetical protein
LYYILNHDAKWLSAEELERASFEQWHASWKVHYRMHDNRNEESEDFRVPQHQQPLWQFQKLIHDKIGRASARVADTLMPELAAVHFGQNISETEYCGLDKPSWLSNDVDFG